MKTRETTKHLEEEGTPPNLFILFAIGFAMTVIGWILISAATAVSQVGSSSLGGVIFIGPIPIVFGAGHGAQWLILLAIIVATLSVIMLLTLHRKTDGAKG